MSTPESLRWDAQHDFRECPACGEVIEEGEWCEECGGTGERDGLVPEPTLSAEDRNPGLVGRVEA